MATSAETLVESVRAGLSREGQKELQCKYLYDEIGSALFEVISVLPEYGLTRAGERLVRQYADDIVARLPLPVVVAELGSGSGKNTRWILEALGRRQRTIYCPIEISPSALAQCQRELGCIDRVSILGFEKEYLDGLRSVASRRPSGEHLLVLFLGSTIGNFDPEAGRLFLGEVRGTMLPGDSLLLAADLQKPADQLLPAYDDPLGVTAAFNLNLLARINRELDADFRLANFRHETRYNCDEHRIEMHLRSTARQTVRIAKAGLEITLEKGETIWTESSYKYTPQAVIDMAATAGFRCEIQWIDQEWPFAQTLFRA